MLQGERPGKTICRSGDCYGVRGQVRRNSYNINRKYVKRLMCMPTSSNKGPDKQSTFSAHLSRETRGHKVSL